MLLPLAALALARQEPFSPDVVLPPGWRVEFFPHGDHSKADLVGPRGQRVAFPAYGGGLIDAAAVHAKDPAALFDRAFLGGRPVEVALQKDGTLTMSLGERLPDEHRSDNPVTFVTTAKTAQDAAQALLIVLTRLDAPARDPVRDQLPRRAWDALGPATTVPGLPPGTHLSLPAGFAAPDAPTAGTSTSLFKGPDGLSLTLHDGGRPPPEPPPSAAPRAPRWRVTGELLGVRLSVRGDGPDGLTVSSDRVPSPHVPRYGPFFTVPESSPRAAVVAILAQLTYFPAPPGPPL